MSICIEIDSVLNYLQFISPQKGLKSPKIQKKSNLFPLEDVQRCQCCQFCVIQENSIVCRQVLLFLVENLKCRTIGSKIHN